MSDTPPEVVDRLCELVPHIKDIIVCVKFKNGKYTKLFSSQVTETVIMSEMLKILAQDNLRSCELEVAHLPTPQPPKGA